MNSWIKNRWVSFANQPALAGRGNDISYTELIGLWDKAAEDLEKLNLKLPTVVGVVGGYSSASVVWLMVLEAAGHLIVPLLEEDEEISQKVTLAGAQYLIFAKTKTWDIKKQISEAPNHPFILELINQKQSGIVLFSSGTSGPAKLMVQNFSNLLGAYKDKRSHRLSILIILGFDHIGGINTLLGILSSGGLMVIPEDKSPARVIEAIEQYKVTVLPASPSFLNLLALSGLVTPEKIKSLHLITYGTEPMPETLLERIRATFLGIRLKQTFGTTETGILHTESVGSDSNFLRFTDPGLQWKVIDNELWLKSSTQIKGYLNSKNENFTDDGWFRTGDRIEIGPEGSLRILGRMGDMINVGGNKLMPIEVETVILDVPGVIDCRAFGQPNAILGQVVTAEVVPALDQNQETLRAAIRQFCRTRLPTYKVPVSIRFVENIMGNRFKKTRTN